MLFESDGYLWTTNAGGESPHQVSTGKVGGGRVASGDLGVSVDGRTVVFVPRRQGAGWKWLGTGVWRMDLTGENQKQLTKGDSDEGPRISPDGKWVVYLSKASGTQTLWKVPLEGGEPAQLIREYSDYFSFSPDSKLLAYTFTDEELKRDRLAIISIDGGPPTKILDYPEARWAPDGRGFTRVETRADVENIWEYPLDAGKPAQLTDFKSDHICGYRWSQDGKQLAVCRQTSTSDAVLIKNFK
jgi:Tol biopolymer transport system component